MTPQSMGIIQGRLSRPVGGRIQAFPAQTWQEEFALAKDLGLDALEWIFEEPYQENPIWTEAGRREIKKAIAEAGVRVDQVCADYFMERPFFRVSEEERQKNMQIFQQIIPFCAEIGARSLEIPLLDNSRIDTDEEMQIVIRSIREALPVAEKHKLTIAFETSLPPDKFIQFLTALNHPLVKVVYDIGNSASLGFDTAVEIAALGKYLSNVHLKDRVRGGSTVPLGTGNADFSKTFAALKDAVYEGPITLQVARGESGREIETTKSHLAFLSQYI